MVFIERHMQYLGGSTAIEFTEFTASIASAAGTAAASGRLGVRIIGVAMTLAWADA
jgi:hypothetical protein